MLTIYRRHRKTCKQRDDGRSYRRCICPIWVDGLLSGVEIRRSLKTRDWQAAHQLVRLWEAEGRREERPKPIAVKEACDKFISDAEARGLREPTLYINTGFYFGSSRTLPPNTVLHSWWNLTWIGPGDFVPRGRTRTLQHGKNWKRLEPFSVSYTKAVGSRRTRPVD
ncbi:MAG: integrase/recombinase XerD [Acidobacteriaceae bacterium]|nr:integrase/recombinase XerD [Acidobacteriaceae bacterium]